MRVPRVLLFSSGGEGLLVSYSGARSGALLTGTRADAMPPLQQPLPVVVMAAASPGLCSQVCHRFHIQKAGRVIQLACRLPVLV